MLNFDPIKEISLRDYQLAAVDALRDGIRQQRRRQVLVAPTGAGKTVIASHLLREASRKGSYALFVVDRIALVDQTSATLDQYGIRHGVIQGSNHPRWAPREHVQVCSIQTLANRSLPREPDLLIYDEAHCLYKSTLDYMAEREGLIAIGLTATPFTPGMGKHWGGLVNVTTTRKLIDTGFLIEPKIYVARSPDDAEFELKSDGEFTSKSATEAGIKIVGDVVEEWIKKTAEHFGGPVKTIVFSPTVDHGKELCAAFGAAGYTFRQISYLDKDDDARRQIIEEFRRPDSLTHGLVSCGVLTKGFDQADVMCGISCKPYRKSLSSHLQEIGRVMRPIIGGEKRAIWLDHSGNIERFAVDMFDVWGNGAGDMSQAEKRDATPRKREEAQRDKPVCPECSGALRGNSCLCCGWERPARSGIVAVEGSLQEFDAAALGLTARAGLRAECLNDPRKVWEAALAYTHERSTKGGDHALRWAKAIFHGIFPSDWPARTWSNNPPATVDQGAYSLIDREQKRFRKSARRAA